ncbi:MULTISPECIES: hypothetical protein [Streptomyces]|uniref:Uncharacterized protein n=1 Tax=Streptomyces rhizosphaericola TaxID=2564098 RepID=A0ABY2P7G9_9ACTN|nr:MULTISPECIES: hypothetical protein [Streptomyces]ARI54002.1 hypothetical protein A6E92_18815 [Streptomyces sp. S8]MYT96868.1 hypothetical protein [Streptomyces sp. SID8350]NGO85281.1 hypothetical protein [Streptomyces sp. 196(2019)]TGZ02927.1 hypothetical protein E5Z02_28475 [Streptomyces rhizosphaericola]SCK47016.1 hypothetical protein YUWDRAFT_04061 [Streptomyces sp. AmelKG-D3]
MQTLIRTTFTTVCAAAALGAVLLGAGTASGTTAGDPHAATLRAQTALPVTGGLAGKLAGSTPNGNIWGP